MTPARRRWVLPALLCLAIATANTPVAQAVVVGPLVPASGSSPFPQSCNGAPQSGTQYRDAEVEPWVDVDPANGNNLVAMWQQDRYSNGGANGLGMGVSRDGGASWTPVAVESLPKFSRCQGAGEGSDGDYERASDPWLSFGPDGHSYAVSLSFNQTRDLTNAVLVSESKDAGTTWGPVSVIQRDTSPLVFNDKESLTADYGDSRYAYVVWDRLENLPGGSFKGPTWFARTTDGGASWEPAKQIFDPGTNDQTIGNQIVVMPDGDLVNAYSLVQDGTRRVAVMRSSDKGSTWDAQTVVSSHLTAGVRDPATGLPVRTGDIIPEVASDERPGTNTLYLAWQDSRFSAGRLDQIAFSKSGDGGLTWSAPKRISTVPGTQAFTPAIRADAKGNLGVTYYDFRNDTAASPTLATDVWFLHSTDGGNTFTEKRLTPSSFDMVAAPVARGFFVGDYAGLAAQGETFMPVFAQALTGGQADVFGTTVRPSAGSAAPPLPAVPRPPSTRPTPRVQATIRVGRRGRLRRGRAHLRVRCLRPSCTGVLELSAVLRTRGRRRPVLLGARSFRLRRGVVTLRVRLNRRARRITARRRRVSARTDLSLRDDRLSFPVVLRRARGQ